MDKLPIVSGNEILYPSGECLELFGDDFVAAISKLGPKVVTWGESAGLPPDQLIDLRETFKAATGFSVQLEALSHNYGTPGDPGSPPARKTFQLRNLIARLTQYGRLEWRTRKGVRRGFWVPDFAAPVSSLEYAPSPFV